MARGRGVDRKGRSKTEGRFILLPHSVTDTPKFRELTPSSVVVLLAIIHEHNGRNNGAIPFGVLKGKDWGIGPSTVSRALDELIEAGLIERTRNADFTHKRRVARYRLAWKPMQVKLNDAGLMDHESDIRSSRARGTGTK